MKTKGSDGVEVKVDVEAREELNTHMFLLCSPEALILYSPFPRLVPYDFHITVICLQGYLHCTPQQICFHKHRFLIKFSVTVCVGKEILYSDCGVFFSLFIYFF